MTPTTNLSLPPAPAAQRLGEPRWHRGRVTLGLALVVTAILGGTALLRSAGAGHTVLAAARDLPSGAPLAEADLAPVRVRLPAAQLATYARPRPEAIGAHLTTGVPAGALIPDAWLVRAGTPGDLIDYPVPVEQAGIPELRPGDRVSVVASYPDGTPGAGRPSEVLLPSAEVVRLHRDTDGLGGGARVHAVQVRLRKDRLAAVAEAVASGHISMARLAPGDTVGVKAPPVPRPGP